MTHIFPPGEDHLHAMSVQCKCNPVADYDDEADEAFCTHLPLVLNLEVLPEENKKKESFLDNLFG